MYICKKIKHSNINMKEKTYYFICYDGNHTGKEYKNELVGVAESEQYARYIIRTIVDQDQEIYDLNYKEEIHDDNGSLKFFNKKRTKWCKYYIVKRTLYTV